MDDNYEERIKNENYSDCLRRKLEESMRQFPPYIYYPPVNPSLELIKQSKSKPRLNNIRTYNKSKIKSKAWRSSVVDRLMDQRKIEWLTDNISTLSDKDKYCLVSYEQRQQFQIPK